MIIKKTTTATFFVQCQIHPCRAVRNNRDKISFGLQLAMTENVQSMEVNEIKISVKLKKDVDSLLSIKQLRVVAP